MSGQRWVKAPLCALAIALGAIGCGAEGTGAVGNGASLGSCQAGQTQMCLCAGGLSQVQTCQANGTFPSCPCSAQSGGRGGATTAGAVPAGAGGRTSAGMNAAATAGNGGRMASGMPGTGQAGRGGAGGGSAGAGGATMTAGSGGAPSPGTDPFAAERQACVDTINMYRMTLGRMPLVRGTPEQETCSDMGAKKDGDANAPHSSAGSCRGLGGQNTCPGYPLRLGGGTVTGTLNACLKQMWDEDMPPSGVDACIADRTGCFLMHGHWINMQMETYGRVACGFYKMANGNYWMNQNFGR